MTLKWRLAILLTWSSAQWKFKSPNWFAELIFTSHQNSCPNTQWITYSQGLQPSPRTCIGSAMYLEGDGPEHQVLLAAPWDTQPACVWHHLSRCPHPGPHPGSGWWQNGGLLPIIQPSQLLPILIVAAMQGREPQAPSRQELYLPGRGKVVRKAKPHGIQVPLPNWTSCIEHKFKVKSFKNLKTAITEHFIPNTRLSECKVQCIDHFSVKPTLRLIPLLV